MLAFFETNNSTRERISKFYLDLEPELKIAESKSTVTYKRELEVVHQLEVKDVHDLIGDLRKIKSEAEIELLREAIETTNLGLKHALLHLKAGKYEYNLRNAFEFAVAEDQDAILGFDSIVATGENATILHYPTQKDTIKKGDLVLFDVGAAKDYYSADISRTYPESGKFSDIQKKIYEIVLNCNKQTAKFMRPGITLTEANEFAKDFLASECVEKGLLSSKEEIRQRIINEYYPEIECFDFNELVKNYQFFEICQKSVPQAIYCFLISNNLEDAIRNCVAIGGDCDTTGAMAGAIAEAYYQKEKMSDFEEKYLKVLINPQIADIIAQFHKKIGSKKHIV